MQLYVRIGWIDLTRPEAVFRAQVGDDCKILAAGEQTGDPCRASGNSEFALQIDAGRHSTRVPKQSFRSSGIVTFGAEFNQAKSVTKRITHREETPERVNGNGSSRCCSGR
jgi:hypothetical protein